MLWLNRWVIDGLLLPNFPVTYIAYQCSHYIRVDNNYFHWGKDLLFISYLPLIANNYLALIKIFTVNNYCLQSMKLFTINNNCLPLIKIFIVNKIIYH